MQFIDSHTHLDFSEFDSDREAVIQRATASGVYKIIVSSTTANRWHQVKRVCSENTDYCYPAYGLHPMFMHEHKLEKNANNNDLQTLSDCLSNNKAIAIGEIGLDFFIQNPRQQAQINLFIAQLKIATDLGLPVIIHARKSLDIVLKHLRKFPTLRGSIHSFSGSPQQAQQLIDMGYYLSFGGPITYNRATRLHKLISFIPLDAILLETDAPDQPDSFHHKQRNEPSFIVNIAQKIAEIKNLEIEMVSIQTTNNAQELFKFS